MHKLKYKYEDNNFLIPLYYGRSILYTEIKERIILEKINKKIIEVNYKLIN